MAEVSAALVDELLASQLDILRLEAGVRARVITMLNRLERELVARLATENLTAFTKARINSLISQISEVIDSYYLRVSGEAQAGMGAAARAQVNQLIESLSDHFIANITASLPSTTFMERLSTNALIFGAPSADWWERQAQDTAFRFANAVRQGIIQGETNENIVARVAGGRGYPGVMDISRTHARGLVHTSIQEVAAEARMETFRKNSDIITGIRQVSTLDSHTCFTAGHLVLMADGTRKPIEEIKPGDMVVGGLTGAARKVLATRSVIRSTVAIFSNGEHSFQCTPEHLFLTSQGWIEARDLAGRSLCPHVPEWEEVHRRDQQSRVALAAALPGIIVDARPDEERRAAGGLGSYQEIHAADGDEGDRLDAHHARGGDGCGGRCDCGAKDDQPERLQHDEGRRGDNRAAGRGEAAYFGSKEAPLSRSDIRGGGAPEADSFRAESRRDPQGVLCDAGGPREFGGAKQFALAGEAHRTPSEAEDCGGNCQARSGGKEGLARPAAQGEGERGARGGPSETTSRPAMGGGEAGQGFGHDESKMARPCLHRETGRGQSEITEQDAVIVTGVANRSDEIVFDIQVEAPDASFICNGFIVHNSEICIAYDGAEFDLDGEPLEGTDLPFNGGVPRHFGCRSVEVPITKTFRELGIDIPEPGGGERASADGPVKASTTFEQFLERMGTAFQDETLGPGRADLWRRDVITLPQLLDLSGNPLSLEELEAKYG